MPVYLGIDIREDEVLVAAVKTAYRRELVQRFVAAPIVGGGVAQALAEAVRSALGRPGSGDGIAV
ncbi:hypothetical protein ACPW07_30235, partial [Klebsiella pneumoniae]|uniref:hypothetical protein n=1 Tax=Klebsiella pneumoniae TaxID=573 RepID=UPI003CE68870